MGTSFGFQPGRGISNVLLMVIICLMVINNVSAQTDPITPQAYTGSGFSYQGQLRTTNGLVNGTCDLQFSLWNATTEGTQLGSTQSLAGVTVSNGNFTVQLNSSNEFGPNAFNGQARWLQIALKCGSDTEFTTLSPRQAITLTPYALALPGLHTQQNATSNNIIGGYEGNTISDNVYGASITGGGRSGSINNITDNFGTIGGGYNNIAGNNSGTLDDAIGATVGGGRNNHARDEYSTVPGGYGNTAGPFSFAAGQLAKATHKGSFVWADTSTPSSFYSSADNQFAVRADNGFYLARDAGQNKTVPRGTYYRDNAIIAWGRISGSGYIEVGFNVESVSHPSPGIYTVKLRSGASYGANLIPIVNTEVDGAVTGAANMRIPIVNQLTAGDQFDVYIYNGNFNLINNDFIFIVTGR
jgi:hypothetical protein